MQMEKPIICTANQNGSQADCELGNPLKRDSEVLTRELHTFSRHSVLLEFKCLRCFYFFLLQTTFYIILSTAGITLDTTELDIDLQLQT